VRLAKPSLKCAIVSGVREAAAFEVLQGLGTLLQRFVVGVGHLAQDALVVGIGFEGRVQLHGRGGAPGDDGRRRCERGMVFPPQIDGVAEADAAAAHDPVNYGAAGLAGAETVPQVLLGADDEGRLAVLAERAQAQEVGAAAGERDALRFDQALEGDLALEPVELGVADARHPKAS